MQTSTSLGEYLSGFFNFSMLQWYFINFRVVQKFLSVLSDSELTSNADCLDMLQSDLFVGLKLSSNHWSNEAGWWIQKRILLACQLIWRCSSWLLLVESCRINRGMSSLVVAFRCQSFKICWFRLFLVESCWINWGIFAGLLLLVAIMMLLIETVCLLFGGQWCDVALHWLMNQRWLQDDVGC